MPSTKLPNVEISVKNPTSQGSRDAYLRMSVSATVDEKGVFSVTVPDYLEELARSAKLPPEVALLTMRGTTRLKGMVLPQLREELTQLFSASVAAEETIERVIRYNVASHISFAEDSAGQIFPNAGWPGARWPIEDRALYGGHHATNPAKDGYSLVVGAEAWDKRTIRRGDHVKVVYEPIPEAHSHGGVDESEPLKLLNSWGCFKLPEDAKEMPYTPQAALFFHRLMLGMSELSRRVQTFMNDEQRLLAAIEAGAPLLGMQGQAGKA